MCELFGMSAKRKMNMTGFLKTFYSHSEEHKNGWGLALLDGSTPLIDRESIKALDSKQLKTILNDDIATSRCIAHIRRATIGEENKSNTHPFVRQDASGRLWVLAHNGTIFESNVLAPYQYVQKGTTDSERILLYIVDEMNRYYGKKGQSLSRDERIKIIENVIRRITSGNKVNLMIYDGELFYVHKNEEKTLYEKGDSSGIIFSTTPLDTGRWQEFPQNRLMVYRDGKLIYSGKKHHNTYVEDKEKMKLLFLDCAGL